MREIARDKKWTAIAVAFAATCIAAKAAATTTCGTMNPNASVVQLRQHCDGAPDCCETTGDLVQWIGSRPAMTPLVVDVGPGAFDRLTCGTSAFDATHYVPSYSNVTFRGAGRGLTIFKASQCPYVCGGIEAYGAACHDLAYADMTGDSVVYGGIWGPATDGTMGGNSLWNNVEILGSDIGWYEITTFGCNANALATHRWFHSSIVARTPDNGAGWGYMANCSISEFYGSDISVVASATTPGGTHEGFAALSVGGGSELPYAGFRTGRARLIGSTLRVVAPDWVQAPPADGRIQAVLVREAGVLEMPDGTVDVAVASGNASEVAGLVVHAGGAAFADGAAFNVRRVGSTTEGGPTSRVITDPPVSNLVAVVDAPYLQPPGTDPPAARNDVAGSQLMGSLTGADLFVETDCAPGGCSATGTETHLLLYKAACLSKWFDTKTRLCR